MSKITLFVGDVDDLVSASAKMHCADARLLDQKNYLTIFDVHPQDITMYTSLGDLPKDLTIVYQIFNHATEIIYCNKDSIWSDRHQLDIDNVTESMQGLTEYMLAQINKTSNKVKNLDLKKYQSDAYTLLIAQRSSNNQQLWVAGGSDVEGVGVDTQQRFGQLLADRLSMPVSFLAKAGSSIEYQADQILRSDILENDIVVWGIPTENRVPFWSEQLNQVLHLSINHRDQDINGKIDLSPAMLDKLLTNKNCFYQSLIHIYQVLNFCKKINAKLLIVGLTISDTLALHLYHVSNFINYNVNPGITNYIDLGNDHTHPGPKQHQAYADFCQAQLKKLNFI